MNDGAIDFRQMLKEEKKKARRKQQQKKDAAEAKIPSAEQEPLQVSIREEDVEAIDFGKLKQKLQQEQTMAESWSIPAEFDGNQHLVCSNPPNIYFVPDFLPRPEHQQALMEWLQSVPENPHQSSTSNPSQANGAWTVMQYAKRRVALWDETLGELPAPLRRIGQELVAQGIFPSTCPPNHVLVNEYHAGQGILPHTDGPAYWSRTATLSLGSEVLVQFTPRPNYCDNSNTTPVVRQLKLPKGCLLVFEDSAYLDYCHGIDDRALEETVQEGCLNATPGEVVQRGYRISLTFRHKKQ